MIFQGFRGPQNGYGWVVQRKKLWFFGSCTSKSDFGTPGVLASSLPKAFLDTYGPAFWASVVLVQHLWYSRFQFLGFLSGAEGWASVRFEIASKRTGQELNFWGHCLELRAEKVFGLKSLQSEQFKS